MKREWWGVLLLVLVFVTLRLPGVALPLHQDEYKWPQIVNPAHISETEIPHPPLSQFIYQTAGELVGYDVHFRYVPLLFGVANLLLLYVFLRHRFDGVVALVGAGLFTFSFYSVLASLMVDTDGQILPFFFLLALISYDRLKVLSERSTQWYFWLALLMLSSVSGFFVKVSFVLAIGALVVDFLWERKDAWNTAQALHAVVWLCGGGLLLVGLLVFAQVIFPFFNLLSAVAYWEHFWTIDRNWFQTAIQVVKAVLYTSPLLVVPALFVRGVDFVKLRVFVLFLLFGMLFYTVVFDFSIGALDRYLQFVVIPLCALSAVTIVRLYREERVNMFVLLFGLVLACVLYMLQFLPHGVPSLYPKSAWVGRILSFNWTFLYPFSGGSGPLGFYVSFLFLGYAWITAGTLVVGALVRPRMRVVAITLMLPMGLLYNAVFIEEYMVGNMNGFAPGLVARVVPFIAENPEIQNMVVYNDNGGNEIQEIGKYEKRLYTSPQFDVNDKIKTMNAFRGHYLVVDVPRIDPYSVFAKYFATCDSIYKDTDKAMSAVVYDCRKAPLIQR